MNSQNNDDIEMPMISILVITYNQENYISETLESIINQEHNYSIEIIIGDDCSTDNTRQIIQKYKKKYPSIINVIFNETNLGLIKNYYNIVSKCTGKYFMVCAGDDYWLPGKIKTQIELLEDNPSIGMCYSKAVLFNDKKKVFLKNTSGTETDFNKQLYFGNFIPAPSITLRKELFDNYIKEINPLEQKWIMEDSPIWFWFLKKTQVHFIDKPFCVYRIISKSISHPQEYKKIIDYENSCLQIRLFYIKYFKLDKSIEEQIINRYNTVFIDLSFKYFNFHDFIKYISIINLKGIKKLLSIKCFFYIAALLMNLRTLITHFIIRIKKCVINNIN